MMVLLYTRRSSKVLMCWLTMWPSTLGPKGRNVLLREGKPPFIQKDGVTVSRFVKLEDPFMDAAAQSIKEASERTNTTHAMAPPQRPFFLGPNPKERAQPLD